MKMFPTYESDELIFEDPSLMLLDQDNNILEDLLADCNASASNLTRKTKKKKKINYGAEELKKSVHRDIERQRRQEMAALYASLRTLLPLEYVKGKRAISDHMDQAVKYIKDMHKKMDEMKMRRDKLKKKLSSSRNYNHEIPNSSCDSCSVSVNVLGGGAMEILIHNGKLNDGYCSFPLSKVVAHLIGLGLDVITCVSTTCREADQSCLYTLHIHEVNEEMGSIDVSKLKEGLINLIENS